jgi:hypothetical protein
MISTLPPLPRLFAYLMLDYAYDLRRARVRRPDKEPSDYAVEAYVRLAHAKRRAWDAAIRAR